MTRFLIPVVTLLFAPASFAQVNVAPDSLPVAKAERLVEQAGDSLEKAREQALRSAREPGALERVRTALRDLDQAASAESAQAGSKREHVMDRTVAFLKAHLGT